MARRDEIVAEAGKWIGVKWRHQGRTRESGIDCVGLIVVVCQALHISDYDSAAYDRRPDSREFLRHFTEAGAIRINPLDVDDGDVLAFHQAGYPCHVGFSARLTGRAGLIHAHATYGSVRHQALTDKLPVVAAYRLPGVGAG